MVRTSELWSRFRIVGDFLVRCESGAAAFLAHFWPVLVRVGVRVGIRAREGLRGGKICRARPPKQARSKYVYRGAVPGRLFFFVLLRTHHVTSDVHVKYSRACIMFLKITCSVNNTLPCARLAPATLHQRHVRVANQTVTM